MKKRAISFSATSKTVLGVLGQMIKAARLERRMSQAELAERVGVSRFTIISIEKADPKVAIGAVLESAAVLGIPLLADDAAGLTKLAGTVANLTTLLPSRSKRRLEMDDDF